MFAVLSANAIPDHLRGYVSRVLQQTGPNLYVGKVSARVAAAIWESLVAHAEIGAVVLITSAANDAGFQLRIHGESAITASDFDGIVLPAEGRTSANPLVK